MAQVTFLRDWTGSDGVTRRQGEKHELDDGTARALQEQGVIVPLSPQGSGWNASPQGSGWNGENG